MICSTEIFRIRPNGRHSTKGFIYLPKKIVKQLGHEKVVHLILLTPTELQNVSDEELFKKLRAFRDYANIQKEAEKLYKQISEDIPQIGKESPGPARQKVPTLSRDTSIN